MRDLLDARFSSCCCTSSASICRSKSWVPIGFTSSDCAPLCFQSMLRGGYAVNSAVADGKSAGARRGSRGNRRHRFPCASR